MKSFEDELKEKTLQLPTDRKIGLMMVEGANAGHAFVLSSKARVTFGREGADVDVGDPTVSKLHCAVEIYNDLMTLRDLGSATGTFLNDFQVKDVAINDKDKFKLGNTVFQILVKKKQAG